VHRLSNPEVATKHLARTEISFFEHRANCSRNIIRQGRPGPEIVTGAMFDIRMMLVDRSLLPATGLSAISKLIARLFTFVSSFSSDIS
jgi:hypothetical protein